MGCQPRCLGSALSLLSSPSPLLACCPIRPAILPVPRPPRPRPVRAIHPPVRAGTSHPHRPPPLRQPKRSHSSSRLSPSPSRGACQLTQGMSKMSTRRDTAKQLESMTPQRRLTTRGPPLPLHAVRISKLPSLPPLIRAKPALPQLLLHK